MFEWIFGIALLTIYFFCLFTVCSLTFRKGYSVLGIAGIFMPLLWLIGAVMPAKDGSAFDLAERERYLGTAANAPR